MANANEEDLTQVKSMLANSQRDILEDEDEDDYTNIEKLKELMQ